MSYIENKLRSYLKKCVRILIFLIFLKNYYKFFYVSIDARNKPKESSREKSHFFKFPEFLAPSPHSHSPVSINKKEDSPVKKTQTRKFSIKI